MKAHTIINFVGLKENGKCIAESSSNEQYNSLFPSLFEAEALSYKFFLRACILFNPLFD